MKLQREDIHPLQDTCPYFPCISCPASILFHLADDSVRPFLAPFGQSKPYFKSMGTTKSEK